jgi:hypothetical protein
MEFDEDDDDADMTIHGNHDERGGLRSDDDDGDGSAGGDIGGDLGDEFDDFEEGVGGEDFGDFDGGFQAPAGPRDVEQPTPIQFPPASKSIFVSVLCQSPLQLPPLPPGRLLSA